MWHFLAICNQQFLSRFISVLKRVLTLVRLIALAIDPKTVMPRIAISWTETQLTQGKIEHRNSENPSVDPWVEAISEPDGEEKGLVFIDTECTHLRVSIH